MITKRFLFIILLGLVLTFGITVSAKAKCACVCKNNEGLPLLNSPDMDNENACSSYCVEQGGTMQTCTVLDELLPAIRTTVPPDATRVDVRADSGSAPIGDSGSAPDGSGSGSQSQTTQTYSLDNPLGDIKSVPQIIGKVISVIISLLGVVALVMFIYAGSLWLFSGGDAQKVKKGKDTMVWAVAGLLLVFSSYILVNYVFKALSF